MLLLSFVLNFYSGEGGLKMGGEPKSSQNILRANHLVVRAWVMQGGQTRRIKKMALSSSGYAQVNSSISENVGNESFVGVFAGNGIYLNQSAREAMKALGKDRLISPEMKVCSESSLGTLMVDELLPAILGCRVGFCELQEDLARRAGGMNKVQYSHLRSVASRRVDLAVDMFQTVLCQLVRQAAILAVGEGLDKTSILLVCQSPLLNSLTRDGRNTTLFNPADMICLTFKVPLQLGIPVSHLGMEAAAIEQYFPCPWVK